MIKTILMAKLNKLETNNREKEQLLVQFVEKYQKTKNSEHQIKNFLTLHKSYCPKSGEMKAVIQKTVESQKSDKNESRI